MWPVQVHVGLPLPTRQLACTIAAVERTAAQTRVFLLPFNEAMPSAANRHLNSRASAGTLQVQRQVY